MDTELGKVTHRYWWENSVYFRQPLTGGKAQYWDGSKWQTALLIEANKKLVA